MSTHPRYSPRFSPAWFRSTGDAAPSPRFFEPGPTRLQSDHRRVLSALLLATALSLGAAKLSALIISGGTTSANQRFSGTFPTAPTANSSFQFSSFDFSGVGWQTASSAFGVTLISPQEYLTAAHVAPAAGSTVTFLGADNVLHTYTVASTTAVTLPLNGATTDLVVGRLTAPISPSDRVAFYPTLVLSSFNAYLNLPVVMYGQTGVVGTNNVQTFFVNVDVLPFGTAPDGTADSILLSTQFDAITGEAQAQGGDSGSPTFIIASGQLALVGVHSAINGAPPPELTLDSFVPSFYSQINSVLNGDGYTFGALTAVPEPGTTALLAGLAASGVIAWRRRTSLVTRV
ncbi:MAG: trypsin-like serine protease [Opitutae bacterium]|nr:trypsin-like serine protease [Opitutae bacterium]